VRAPLPQPDLLSARLRLRSFVAPDAGDVQRLAGDFAVADTTLTIPHPYPDGVAESWIASLHAPDAGDRITYALTERLSGALIGAMGLALHVAHERGEIGYWVGKPFWNRGYATEAARVVLMYAFGTLGLRRVHARSFARNPASGRVLEKIGMRQEGMMRQHVRRWERFEDVVLYGILREEWEQR
jgi:ribosomal-protein-alanine N-acetyltransferase